MGILRKEEGELKQRFVWWLVAIASWLKMFFLSDKEVEERRRAIVGREALILSVNIEASFPILTSLQTS